MFLMQYRSECVTQAQPQSVGSLHGCTDNFSSHPRDVHIYDARCLNSRRSQPLLSLAEHTKSIASAYFSPVTGNRVVTTCADCKLRYRTVFFGESRDCCYGVRNQKFCLLLLLWNHQYNCSLQFLFPSFHFYSLSPTPSFFVPLLGLPVFQADLELALFLLWPLEYWDYRFHQVSQEKLCSWGKWDPL